MIKIFLSVMMAISIAVPAYPSNIPANDWYTQIGFWHLQKDTVSGRSFLYHNAHVDGAKSGEATANVRFNKGFQGLTKFEARMALGPAPSLAGLLIQTKPTTYYFFVKKEKTGTLLQICRRKKTELATVFVAPVSIPDTVLLQVNVKQDSLVINAGKTTASLAKPADFSGNQWVGFECLGGVVKVFSSLVVSKDGETMETFDHASLINLHLEKMFSSKK
jgi:hypothetical protein